MTVLEDTTRTLSRIEKVRRLLAKLEQRLPTELPDSGDVPLLLAQVGSDRVAFLLSSVDEALSMVRLSPLPETPPWVAGLLDYHGDLVPVVDVAGRITRSRREVDETAHLLLLTVDGHRRGLIVDAVMGVHVAPRDELLAPPREGASAPYLMALWEHEAASVLVLSSRRLLAASGETGAE